MLSIKQLFNLKRSRINCAVIVFILTIISSISACAITSSSTIVTSSLNPSIYRQTVTFTVTVSGSSPTGSVQLMVDGTQMGSAHNLSNGSATFSTYGLSVGTHSVYAIYNGDTSNTSSTSGTISQVVNPVASATIVTSSPNPSEYRQTVTFTVTVTGYSPTGSVLLYIDGTQNGSAHNLSNGSATFSTYGLSLGSHSIYATYSGDTNNTISTSPTISQAVNKVTTAVTLTSSLNPSLVGQNVTFNASVNGYTPTGTIQFVIDGNNAGSPVALSSGSASYTVSDLVGGSHNVSAVYSGDSNNTTSTSSPLTQVVKTNSVISLVSSINPSNPRQNVTFSATVTGNSPTGTVQFVIDGVNSGNPVVLSSGIAAYSVSTLTLGSHNVSAVYNGDDFNQSNTSNAVSQNIVKTPTSTNLTSSANPSVYRQTVTFTVNISGSSPTGSVQLFVDGSQMGSAHSLINGAATFSTYGLSVGAHSVYATYTGDDYNASSTSSTISQVVNPVASTTIVTSSLNPSEYRQNVTFTVTVTGYSPTGTVSLFIDGVQNGSAHTLSSGVSTFSTYGLSVGTHSVTATYGGDTNNSVSASTALNQVVNKASTSISLSSSANPVILGSSVTFTTTSSPSIPNNENVTFYDGDTALGNGTITNGVATYTTSLLAFGTHNIKAMYSGNSSYAGSVSNIIAMNIIMAPPVITSGPTADPSPVTGTIANLSVVATDNTGESNLTYSWTATGPADVSFSATGTNAAKNTTATFTKAGSYTIQVTVANPGASTTAGTTIVVNQTPASINIVPNTASVNALSTTQFTASLLDQFNNQITTGFTPTWSNSDSTIGSINNDGLFTALNKAGQTNIQCVYNGTTGVANVTVNCVIPSAPTGLTAEPHDGYILLEWNDVDESVKYNIKRKNANGEYITINPNPLDSSFYGDNQVINGDTYQYVVVSISDCGESNPSAEITVSPKAMPSSPDNIQVGTITQTSVNLSWNASLGADLYRIQLNMDGGIDWTELTTTSSTSITITNLKPATQYYYRVVASNNSGYSLPSIEVAVLTIPSTPLGISAAVQNNTGCISWLPSDGAVSYNIYKYMNGSYVKLNTIALANSMYTDRSLAIGTYLYKVSSVNDTGESPLSSSISLTINESTILTNLLCNGSFETGNLDFWISKSATITDRFPYDGNYHVEMLPDGYIKQVVYGLLPNTDYVLSGNYKNEIDGDTTAVCIVLPSGGFVNATSSHYYTRLILPFKTASTDTYMLLCILKKNGSGKAYCDNFELTKK